jgi:hypothetical protein
MFRWKGRRPRIKVLLDKDRPKVPHYDLVRTLQQAGAEVASGRADFGVAVGGDGMFGRVGRDESIPLLLVGVRADGPTGSRAFLASTYYDRLGSALKQVASGRFRVEEHRRLSVSMNGRRLGEVFTDVYLQRGADSNCIRYSVKVSGRKQIDEWAVSDGVVVCTRAGATGYYSYLDKLRGGESLEPGRYTLVGEEEVGICHIMPTYSKRKKTRGHPLRYSVPWGSKIRIGLDREADARLYGVGHRRKGLRVRLGDVIDLSPAGTTTKVIRPLG